MFVTAYTASTFAFNVIVTGLICGRLAYFQRYMQRYYGAERRLYGGAVAIVVESALPFTLFNLAYLVAFAVGTDLAFAFSFYAMFTVSSFFQSVRHDLLTIWDGLDRPLGLLLSAFPLF